MKYLLFVYGTLKMGHQRHSYLSQQRYIGIAATSPNYRMYRYGSYPAIIEEDNGLKIFGELYEISDHCLMELDRLEGVESNLFVRKIINLDSLNLFSLPTQKNVSDDLFSNQAHAYFFSNPLKLVGAKDCGSNWTN